MRILCPEPINHARYYKKSLSIFWKLRQMAELEEIPIHLLRYQNRKSCSFWYLFLMIFPQVPSPKIPLHKDLSNNAHPKRRRFIILQPPILRHLGQMKFVLSTVTCPDEFGHNPIKTLNNRKWDMKHMSPVYPQLREHCLCQYDATSQW